MRGEAGAVGGRAGRHGAGLERVSGGEERVAEVLHVGVGGGGVGEELLLPVADDGEAEESGFGVDVFLLELVEAAGEGVAVDGDDAVAGAESGDPLGVGLGGEVGGLLFALCVGEGALLFCTSLAAGATWAAGAAAATGRDTVFHRHAPCRARLQFSQ